MWTENRSEWQTDSEGGKKNARVGESQRVKTRDQKTDSTDLNVSFPNGSFCNLPAPVL